MSATRTYTLRKACTACSKAKRSCKPELPTCERCRSRGVECKYDLEPVAGVRQSNEAEHSPQTQVSHLPGNLNSTVVYSSTKDAQQSVTTAFREGRFDEAASHPLMMNHELLTWLSKYYVDMLNDVAMGLSTPFIHSSVVTRARVFATSESKTSGPLEETNPLEYGTIRQMSLELLKIHELTVFIINALIKSARSNFAVEKLRQPVEELFTRTFTLWSRAQPGLNLAEQSSPFESWTVIESVRRSMMNAVNIRALWSGLCRGYCRYEPFYESVPFDPRRGVWEAMSEHAWIKAVEKHGGQEDFVVSINEFAQICANALPYEFDGKLQRSLFISHHGVQGLHFLQNLPI